jgi:hypothetical protein
MARLTPGAGLIAALGRKILFYIYALLARPYDLKEEARLAGFSENVSHFRAFLDNCPKYATGMYGQRKYRALREQVGLPQGEAGHHAS